MFINLLILEKIISYKEKTTRVVVFILQAREVWNSYPPSSVRVLWRSW
jgi:hypothetical protein